MAYRLYKLGEYLRGWAGYFGISQCYRPVPGIDDWIRRRIRMCYWRQRHYGDIIRNTRILKGVGGGDAGHPDVTTILQYGDYTVTSP